MQYIFHSTYWLLIPVLIILMGLSWIKNYYYCCCCCCCYCYYYKENCFEFEFLFLCDFKFASNLGWLILVYSVICKELS